MDQRLVNHLLDTLLSVVRFGGQGFVKVANSTPIRRSSHPGLVKRIENCRWNVACRPLPVLTNKIARLAPGDGTYLDAVLDVLIQ